MSPEPQVLNQMMLKTEAHGFRNQGQHHYNTAMGKTANSSKFGDARQSITQATTATAQITRKNTVLSSARNHQVPAADEMLVNISVPSSGPMREIKRQSQIMSTINQVAPRQKFLPKQLRSQSQAQSYTNMSSVLKTKGSVTPIPDTRQKRFLSNQRFIAQNHHNSKLQVLQMSEKNRTSSHFYSKAHTRTSSKQIVNDYTHESIMLSAYPSKLAFKPKINFGRNTSMGVTVTPKLNLKNLPNSLH